MGLTIFSLLLCLNYSLAFAGSSLSQWMDFEQNRINRSVDSVKLLRPTINAQKIEFRPESGKWFNLPSIWVPETELDTTQILNLLPKEIRSEFVRFSNGQSEFRLFIHPESRKFYKSLLAKFPEVVEHQATATASSRTLLVRSIAHPERQSFVKVSLAVKLARVLRTVLRQEIARSIGTTAYIHALQDQLSSRFDIMDEPLGIIPKGWDEGGQIVRPIPSAIQSGEVIPVPLFSLYAEHPNGILLEDLAKRANMTPEQFVIQHINQPFAEGWADWAIKGSMTMEPHAQNVLLELNHEGLPNGKILLRDLGGFNIDSSSSTFRPKLLQDMPYIKSFAEDYLQDEVSRLHNASLDAYYVGGFLYNIEAYLKKTNPQYVKDTVTNKFWEQVVNEVKKVSGFTDFTAADLEFNAYPILQKARRKFRMQNLAKGLDPTSKPKTSNCSYTFSNILRQQ